MNLIALYHAKVSEFDQKKMQNMHANSISLNEIEYCKLQLLINFT